MRTDTNLDALLKEILITPLVGAMIERGIKPPICFECGERATHVWERDYEPKRYLCQPCFQEWEHNEERNDERVTEERGRGW